MKYLAYLVEKSYGWDEEDKEYEVRFREPERYETYKTVTIEVIQESKSLGDIFQGGDS